MSTDTSSSAFDTALEICGPLRSPRQMLADQEYGGHESIHDDAMAEKLGFRAGPIEGPTHFSQFQPLLDALWGEAWWTTGCLSAHYRNMVVEGEQVRAFVERPTSADQTQVRIRAEKADGTEVLVGTASIGAVDPEQPTELEGRIARLRPPEQLVILADLEVGQKGRSPEAAVMEFDQHMGNLYPFSLAQKLDKITEPSPWYHPQTAVGSPWGRAAIPMEMISVLAQYTSHEAGFESRGPAIGLFAGQQIRMIRGPLLVGQPYRIEREILALSESRRTESNWIRSTIFESEGSEPVAEMILNSATLKDSYAPYAEELEALRAGRS